MCDSQVIQEMCTAIILLITELRLLYVYSFQPLYLITMPSEESRKLGLPHLLHVHESNCIQAASNTKKEVTVQC